MFKIEAPIKNQGFYCLRTYHFYICKRYVLIVSDVIL